ncbi:hypothetical protein [Longitalea luteola]|uniref:hypothetical protein n=1 Tax=Longitalea luteola TaxID=2812563 RepID=UPI001A96A4BC|nr:hypothetical protein [Longitalea luteola]
MKKLLIATCLAFAATAGPTTAQQASRPIVADNMSSLHMNARNINRVPIKVMRDFLKRSPSANDANWMEVETGFVAKYIDKKNNFCRTVYNSRGSYVYTVKQYAERNLPREVRGIVKSQYYDYTITLVEEVHQPLKPLVYIVHLEDATSFKHVQVSEGEMEVTKEYKKTF